MKYYNWHTHLNDAIWCNERYHLYIYDIMLTVKAYTYYWGDSWSWYAYKKGKKLGQSVGRFNFACEAQNDAERWIEGYMRQ